jgi:hypothetical protein
MRSIAKLLSQALLLLAPMLTLGVSVLDGLGYKPDGAGNITVNLFSVFPLYGKKESIELSLRMFITLGGFATIVAYEFFDYILPRRDLDEFRRAYLKQQKNDGASLRVGRNPEGYQDQYHACPASVVHTLYRSFLLDVE